MYCCYSREKYNIINQLYSSKNFKKKRKLTTTNNRNKTSKKATYWGQNQVQNQICGYLKVHVVSKYTAEILWKMCCKKKEATCPPVFPILLTARVFPFFWGLEGERGCTLVWGTAWVPLNPFGAQWPSQAITVAILVPLILHPSLGPRWLPESSRWLLLHGKSQVALKNLRKVAAINGRKEEGERLTKEVGRSGAS